MTTREEGIWWRPELPDETFEGALVIDDDDQITIELRGRFSGWQEAGLNVRTFDRLEGRIRRTQLNTVLNCYETSFDLIAGRYCTLRCGTYLGGAHVDPTKTRFNDAYLGFDEVLQWAAVSGIKTEVAFGDNSGSTTIAWDYPDTPQAELRPGQQIGIRIYGGLDRSPSKTGVNEHGEFHFHDDNGFTLESIEDTFFKPIQDLLTFSLGYAPRRRSASVGARPADEGTEPLGARIVQRTYPTFEPRDRERWIIDHEVFFLLADFEQGFEKLIRNWFAVHDKFRYVIIDLLSAEYASFSYVTNEFLNVARSAEVFARDSGVAKNDLAPDALDAVKRALTKDVPPAFSEAFKRAKGLLGLLGKPPFASCLRAMINELAVMPELLPLDAEDYVRKESGTRNLLTHRSDQKHAVKDPIGQQLLTETTALLVRSCLMLQLGFSPTSAQETLIRNVEVSYRLRQQKAPSENDGDEASTKPPAEIDLTTSSQIVQSTPTPKRRRFGLHRLSRRTQT